MIKIGDRVKAKKDCPRVGGMVGTVVCFEKDSKTDENYGVSFDKFKKGHSLNRELKGNESGSGWWMNAENLEKASKKIKIVITDNDDRIEAVVKDAKGKKTKMLKYYKRGENFESTYPSLLQQVVNKIESPKLNAKIKITRGDDTFIEGHVYELKDGIFITDFENEFFNEFMKHRTFKSMRELKKYFGFLIDFVEVEED